MQGVLTADETAKLCERCGRCCIAHNPEELLGGTKETDDWLRMPNGECRFLLPPDAEAKRFCAIHDNTTILVDIPDCIWAYRPLRPKMCRLSPCIENIDVLPDCPVTRAAKEKLECSD